MKKLIYILLIAALFSSCNRKVIESIQTSNKTSEQKDSSSYVETIVPISVEIPADSVAFQIPITLDSLMRIEPFEIVSEGKSFKVTAEIRDNKLQIKAVSKPQTITVPVVQKQTFKSRDNIITASNVSSYTKKVTPWWINIVVGLCSTLILIVAGYFIYKKYFK